MRFWKFLTDPPPGAGSLASLGLRRGGGLSPALGLLESRGPSPGDLQPQGRAPAARGRLAQGLCPRSVRSAGLVMRRPQGRLPSPRATQVPPAAHAEGAPLRSQGRGPRPGVLTPQGLGIPSVNRREVRESPIHAGSLPSNSRRDSGPLRLPGCAPGPGLWTQETPARPSPSAPRLERAPQRRFQGGAGES